MSTIKISTDYTKNPGARYSTDGLFSGEDFFHTKLDAAYNDSIAQHQKLTIDLDGTNGYASSFLSEAFGLLAEKYGVQDVLNNLNIISKEEPDWKEAILKDYIPHATERKKKQAK